MTKETSNNHAIDVNDEKISGNKLYIKIGFKKI